MRVGSDNAQKVLDMVNKIQSDFNLDGITEQHNTRYRGNINTKGSIEISEITGLDHDEDIQDVATNIDAEIMDNVFGSVRNNSKGRHEGYNRFQVLQSLNREDQLQQETIQSILGADSRTVQNWYEDFRQAGLTYDEDGSEELTTEGEIFLEETQRFLDDTNPDTGQISQVEYMGNTFSSLSRKYQDQGDKMCGFLLMAETDKSVTEISEEVDTSRRTAYNWSKEWFESETEDNPLFKGEPRERELTQAGRSLYTMIGNQYRRMDTASQLKAELIDQIDEELEEGETRPFIPGNQEMVSQYTDPGTVTQYMTREDT